MTFEASVADVLRKAPRWAIVAFAARCGRRVEPLFQRSWPQAPEHHVEAVSRSIALAENSAAHAGSGLAAVDLRAACKQHASEAKDAMHAAMNALLAAQDRGDQPSFTGLSKATATAKIAESIATTLLAALEGDTESAAKVAASVAELATRVPVGAGVSGAVGNPVVRAAAAEGVHRDLECLQQAVTANANAWNNDTAISPSVFGVL
jgi:hypothetical protein